ncbi:FAD/NAD(P)-binding protein, partial [Shinella sp. M31]|uniref:FAD/NAD(P)-binding protein n=1 Tax=Shinella sp. M31 TaxID=3368615 RepID=UPI003BA160D1
MRQETDVAVIGSGFSAVALALNLVELAPPTARISLVGAREAQGRGIAYATTADCHRLNVPAGRMSLFADRPDHF